jgi:hypothetical protein
VNPLNGSWGIVQILPKGRALRILANPPNGSWGMVQILPKGRALRTSAK